MNDCCVRLRERIYSVGRGHVPAGELPTAYKPVRLYCPPLRGRHARWSCPTNRLSHPRRRGRRPRRPACRNYQLRTNPFVSTVRRFAGGTPGGLRRGFRRRSLTDAAYPLRVRALRIVYRTCAAGRNESARPQVAASSIFCIKIPYPCVGSSTRTWVTAPISLPFCTIGLPDIPCTMPPVAANSAGSVTSSRRFRP